MRSLFIVVLCLAGCGGGGGSGPVLVVLPTVDAISGPLSSVGGTAFTVTGTAFPGAPGAPVTIRLTAAEGTPFDTCTSAAVEITGVLVSAQAVDATAVATILLTDVDAFILLTFGDGTEIVSPTPLAHVVGVPNTTLDQDLNGLADRCDPNTYDFESDAVGDAPAGIRTLGGVDASLVVKDVAGDRAAAFTSSAPGQVAHRLERLMADHAHQETTAYIDLEDLADAAHVELWSDGSYLDNAGAGLLLQIQSTGLIRFYLRNRRSLPSLAGPALPANGRIRVRLARNPGTTSSTMHIDAWSAGSWINDHGVFQIADDTPFRGRATVIAKYGLNQRGLKRITVVHKAPPTTLAIAQTPERSMDWKLFQRNDADQALIPVDVIYAAPAGSQLQARVLLTDTGLPLTSHDWGQHARSLSHKATRATLELLGVPTGGNYDVQVRILDAAGTVLAQQQLRNLAVGDIYVAIGQSNMSGYSGSLAGATQPLPEVHTFHNDGTWKQAVEPMDSGTDQTDGVSLESPAHSLMLPFARALYEATGVPVGVIPGSLGGTNLHTQWQRNATTPDWRATLYGSTLWRVREQFLGAPPRGLLWFQGESDAIAGRTALQYRTDLERLLAQYRTDLGAPDLHLLCAQLGVYTASNLPLWLEVQEAERQTARADARVALITTVDQPLADAIHFSVAGYQEIGRRFADAARALIFGSGIDPLTELVSATHTTGGTVIELGYDAAIQGGAASLYRVVDDTGALTVTGLSISGSTATLVLDRPLGTNPLVSYGFSNNPAVAWTTDAGGVPVPCFSLVAVLP